MKRINKETKSAVKAKAKPKAKLVKKKLLEDVFTPEGLDFVQDFPDAPYYDRYGQHVCVFKKGFIPHQQDPTKPYLKNTTKEFRGRHCKICFRTQEAKVCASDSADGTVDFFDQQENLFKDTIKEWKFSIDDLANHFQKIKLADPEFKIQNFKGYQDYQEILIPNTRCVFNRKSYVINKIGGSQPKQIITLSNKDHTIQTEEYWKIFPIYNEFKVTLNPIVTSIPPKFAHNDKACGIVLFWMDFYKFKSTMEEIKYQLLIPDDQFSKYMENHHIVENTPKPAVHSHNSLIRTRSRSIQDFCEKGEYPKFLVKRKRAPRDYYSISPLKRQKSSDYITQQITTNMGNLIIS